LGGLFPVFFSWRWFVFLLEVNFWNSPQSSTSNWKVIVFWRWILEVEYFLEVNFGGELFFWRWILEVNWFWRWIGSSSWPESNVLLYRIQGQQLYQWQKSEADMIVDQHLYPSVGQRQQ
jgi:hypothetical protein